MKLDDKIKALQHLIPGFEYVTRGGEFTPLDTRPMPTDAELEAALPEALHAEAMAEAKQARRARYDAVADPLFFKEKRGEIEAGTWERKIAEIRAEFPYPEDK